MRESVAFLKSNAEKWRERRIDECDRIREEEKKDRLAVAKEKKRKYGLTRLSKEENMRMTMRTGERLEIAKAKENMWKKFRDGKGGMKKEEEEAWRTLREKILELEEEGSWRERKRERKRKRDRETVIEIETVINIEIVIGIEQTVSNKTLLLVIYALRLPIDYTTHVAT
jgi:hypothetical protein